MARTDAWMPLYVGDYLADTMHLGAAEHGAYLLLLMHQWRTGPLPDDDRQLATIARTEPAAWRRIAATLRAFFAVEGGRLVQLRLERVRDEQVGKIGQRSAAGKASAAARQRQREGNGDTPPVDLPLERQARELESESEGTGSLRSPASASPAERPPPDARAALWTEGLARLRRLTGKPDKAVRGLLGQLCKAARDDCALVASVLHEAEQARPGDPVPWIQAAIRTRAGERGTARKPFLPDYADEELFGAAPTTTAYDLDLQAEHVP